ncbi:hypothetical protein [Methylobacterium segetis]|uniref:hypothetical protein n=1 Tax=Methylobacterium segetis TaxID=2488750 RepID=UPI001048348F|nr:hypothetical protein [Methylobacterium segetis]
MSTPSDPKLAKLVADLDAAATALSIYLRGSPSRSSDMGNFVPLKTAAAAWGISEDAALRRARRGHGVKRFGRWYFPDGLVESARKAGGRA